MTVRLGSRGARFSVVFLLAIALPAAILAVLGYVSVRQWEAASAAFLLAQARDMAAMTAEKIEGALLRTEDEIVDRLQSLVRRDGLGPEALRAFLGASPLIHRLYLFDREGHRLFPASWTPEEAEALGAILAELPLDFWDRGGRRHRVAGEQVVLVAVLRAPAGAPVLAVLSRDREVLRREILEETLGNLEGSTIVAVLDQHDRPVYTRGPLDRAERVVTVEFGEALPSLRLALYQPRGMSARSAVQRQITIFTVLFGLLLVSIVAGLVVTYRLVRRETEVAQLKEDFVANVSHDLKTPLSLIRMYGETLEMGRLTDEGRRQEYYRVITRESERLSRLIDNVLDFSRIEGGRRKYDMVPTAVEPLVRETLEAFSYPLTQGGFKVEVSVAANLPEVVMDADAIGQALANLLDNAIKYSGDRRSIRVAVSVRDGHLALSIADEGLGIPVEEQERIFDKFYRVGRSETDGRRGSGVGLALVRHVAEAHGGRVTVASRPGQGSTFTVWLPLAGRPV